MRIFRDRCRWRPSHAFLVFSILVTMFGSIAVASDKQGYSHAGAQSQLYRNQYRAGSGVGYDRLPPSQGTQRSDIDYGSLGGQIKRLGRALAPPAPVLVVPAAPVTTNISPAKPAVTAEPSTNIGSFKRSDSPTTDNDRWSKVDVGDLRFGNNYALIVGNNVYRDLPDLDTAIIDARAVSQVLEQDYGFRVKLLIDASRYDILKALSEFRRSLTKRDNLVLYYAGHGILDKEAERGYWLPVDAESDIKANWISTTDVTDTLKAMAAWHVMVVADSCYSGTLLRNADVELQHEKVRLSVIQRLIGKRSRTVLSSGGVEPVADSGGGKHSVFARAFIDALKENEGILDGQRLFTKIRSKVVLNSDQTPEYSDVRKAGHDGGDFVFVKRSGPSAGS